MRCSLGLLFVVFGLFDVSWTAGVQVEVEIEENLECMQCTTYNNVVGGPDCYSNETNTEQCIQPVGLFRHFCGMRAKYSMLKEDRSWKIERASKGCFVIGSPCWAGMNSVTGERYAVCLRLCDKKRCNDWPIPPSPTSDGWRSAKLGMKLPVLK
jgi:hypothetical protein